jgi:hypothetical protein
MNAMLTSGGYPRNAFADLHNFLLAGPTAQGCKLPNIDPLEIERDINSERIVAVIR